MLKLPPPYWRPSHRRFEQSQALNFGEWLYFHSLYVSASKGVHPRPIFLSPKVPDLIDDLLGQPMINTI
nr:hypothetical protein pJBCL41_00422 [Pseudomonas sp.]